MLLLHRKKMESFYCNSSQFTVLAMSKEFVLVKITGEGRPILLKIHRGELKALEVEDNRVVIGYNGLRGASQAVIGVTASMSVCIAREELLNR